MQRDSYLTPFLALLAAFLCGAPFGMAAPVKKQPLNRLTIHLPHEPASLDWNLSNRRIDSLVINNLQEGLIEVGEGQKPVAVLAKSWDISPDGKTYTLHIRSGVQWSDGKFLTAQQFVDSWKRLLSPITATSNGYFLLEVTGAEAYHKGRESEFSKVGIKALDEKTIEIKLIHPQWNWIWNFAQPPTYPIRQELIDKNGSKFWTAPGNLVTLGPFTLVSHDLDSNFILRKNRKYFRANDKAVGNIDEIEFKLVTQSAAVQAFVDQKIDLVCYVSDAAQASEVAADSLQWSIANTTKRLDFNVKRYPMSVREVREAIALSIDRAKLAKSMGAGVEEGTSASPPYMSTHFEELGMAHDVSRAKKSLKSADIDKLTIEILVPMFDEHADANLKAAQIIRSTLSQDLHAEVTIQKAETEQLYSLLRDTQQYSLLLRDWTATNDPDEFYAFYASFSKKSTTWSNPEYNKILELSRIEKNTAERLKIYRKLDRMLSEQELAVIPLFYTSDAMLVNRRIKGFDRHRPDPCRVRELSVTDR